MATTSLEKEDRSEGSQEPPADVITYVHVAGVTAPPASLGLPSYYTQYKENHSDAITHNSDNVVVPTPSPAAQEPPRKRVRRARSRATSTGTVATPSKASSQKTAKSITSGNTVETMARMPPKPKMAGMRKSSVTAADTTTTSAKKPSEKSSAKSKITSKKSECGGAKEKPTGEQGNKNMKWKTQLTALAIEARFQNKHILKKIATKSSNTKAQRAMWKDTITVFQQRALAERAWDDDGPRTVTVKQFKNELDAVRAGYNAKRLRMLAKAKRLRMLTGNRFFFNR